ncbi:MAG: hypothetical protein ACRDFQ_04790 [Anaerolineales bacterium]
MKLKLSPLFILLCVIILAGCSPSTGGSSGDTDNQLSYGETLECEDGSVKISFVDIVEDSRCAEGVQCEWAGRVQVLLEVTVGSETPQYVLTNGSLLEGDADSITASGISITLWRSTRIPFTPQQIHCSTM